MRNLLILFSVFGGIYIIYRLVKYFSKRLINNFFKNMGVNPEAFKQQQRNNFQNQNDEVVYQKGETVVMKGEAGKNKK